MNSDEIITWLREDNPQKLAEFYARADLVRRENIGDAVHLRGLVEFSNYCQRHCTYCGIRRDNHALPRYRLTRAEVLECAQLATQLNYGTIVLQSGEDFSVSAEWWAETIKAIKDATPLAITLSLGERDENEFALWKKSGAHRYLLRFETSNKTLYQKIHPPRGGKISDRLLSLKILRDLGYEIGSGVMVGVPEQTYADAVNDLTLMREMDFDMIGIGPYLSHPQTPLTQQPPKLSPEQILPTGENTCKMLALARILCPRSNIPSTTALATLLPNGRERGLQCGANILMPNLTPAHYRKLYEIYPEKEALDAHKTATTINDWLKNISRFVGVGAGNSPRFDNNNK